MAACEYLRWTPEQFNHAVRAWPALSRTSFAQHAQSDDFYRHWTGETGRMNICANIVDQFRRHDVCRIAQRLGQTSLRSARILDLGAGTGSVTFAFFPDATVDYVDVPNEPANFLRWRLAQSGRTTHRHLPVEQLAQVPMVDGCLCVDVLEHLPNPSDIFREQIHTRLAPGGQLILRAPWGGHPEHLPDAQRHWEQQGGAQLLATHYRLVESIPSTRGVSGWYERGSS